MSLCLLYGAAVFGASVQALAFPGPQQTLDLEALPQNGWSPKPTAGPDHHALRRRQNGLASTFILAPDNTCGFVNANSRSAVACADDDSRCALIPSSGRVPGAAACCSGSDCVFRVSCVDGSEMDDCDRDCRADSLTLKCTGQARFCNTVVFPLGITHFFCNARRATGALKAETTHSGDRSRSMLTVKPTATASTTKKTTGTSAPSISSASTSGPSSESETPSSSEAPETTSSATDTARAGAATETTAPIASATPPTPAGAIAGGVIGGIAGIAFVVLGVILLRRRKKKIDAAAAAAPPGAFMSQQQTTFPSQQPPGNPFADQSAPPYTSPSPHLSSTTAAPSHLYAVPAATAPAAAGAEGTYKSYNHLLTSSNSNTTTPASPGGYPDPSPLSTPSGSPRPQYQHQPHAPQPLAPPAYYHQYQQQSQQNHDGTWVPDPPDRHSTSTPLSTYNNTIPVSPASALGPIPGDPSERQHQHQHQHQQRHQGSRGSMDGAGVGMGMDAVPLSLLPGRGYRPYRPANSAAVSVPAAGLAPIPGTGTGAGTGLGIAVPVVVARGPGQNWNGNGNGVANWSGGQAQKGPSPPGQGSGAGAGGTSAGSQYGGSSSVAPVELP